MVGESRARLVEKHLHSSSADTSTVIQGTTTFMGMNATYSTSFTLRLRLRMEYQLQREPSATDSYEERWRPVGDPTH